MSKKVLIGYATKCGSTIKVAQVLADTITHIGNVVDVRQMDQLAIEIDYLDTEMGK